MSIRGYIGLGAATRVRVSASLSRQDTSELLGVYEKVGNSITAVALGTRALHWLLQ
jgi:argininosuccinate lyase